MTEQQQRSNREGKTDKEASLQLPKFLPDPISKESLKQSLVKLEAKALKFLAALKLDAFQQQRYSTARSMVG